MVIDTSAVLAILCDEPERRHYNELIVSYPSRVMSVGTYIETAIVTEARFGRPGIHNLKLYLSTAGVELVPCDSEQAEIAVGAYSAYGKGRHRASLNFGDCFAYALSKQRDEPLLFKGDDFIYTDVASATHP